MPSKIQAEHLKSKFGERNSVGSQVENSIP